MSRKRFLIIHNPTSGRRSADFMARVAVNLTNLGARADIRVTEGPGHATTLAGEVTPDSYDCIVAAGGDGTINEVINGLASLDDAPPLGIIPLGTANVLAFELGLTKKPAVIATALVHGQAQALYPGVIQCKGHPPRLFAQMAGVGVDARIVSGVSERLKRFFGKGAYGIEAARQWLFAELPTYQIDIDGVATEAQSIIIINGKLYGGRFMAAPEADISRRGFEVLLLPGSRANMLVNALGLITNRLSKLGIVRVVKGAKITISGPAGEPVQGDGDLWGHLPVCIEAASDPVMVISGT